MKPTARLDLPADHYPFRVEGIHSETGELLFQRVVLKPQRGGKVRLEIPAPADKDKGFVSIRFIWPNGTMTEVLPPE